MAQSFSQSMAQGTSLADPEQEWVCQGGSKYRALEEIARRLRHWLIAEAIDANPAIKQVKPVIFLRFKIAFRSFEIRIADHETEGSCSDFNIVFGEGPNMEDAMRWIRRLQAKAFE